MEINKNTRNPRRSTATDFYLPFHAHHYLPKYNHPVI